MVDDGAAAVGFGDAVVDEALVQGKVGERPGFGQLVAGPCWRFLAVIGLVHESCGGCGNGSSTGSWLPMRQSAVAPGCSVGCLAVWLPTGLFLLAVEVAGWLGDPGDRVGCGQAEFSGPALDVGPEPVPLVQVGFGGGVGQDHRGDGGVAVQGLAGQPGHFPLVLAAGRLPGGVGGLVAGHGGVVDGEGHGGHFRVGVMVRLPGRARGRGGGPCRCAGRPTGWLRRPGNAP